MAAKAGTDAGGGERRPPPASATAFDEKPHLSEAEFREVNYRRLMAEHRTHDAALAEIDATRKARNKLRTIVRDKLSQSGHSLANVDEILEDSGKRNRSEQQARVDELAWMREMEGLPVARTGEQADLFAKLEPTAKDEIEWHLEGYNAGAIGLPCEAPAGISGIMIPTWTKGWHEGKDRRDWALAAERNVERDPEKAAAVGAQPLAKAEAEEEVEPCATCGGDGTKLDPDVDTCPDCGAEYEPAVDGERKSAELVH